MKAQLVIFLALTSVSFAQSSPSIVNNGAAPVRIVSTLAKPSDMLAALTMLNTSGRKVSNVSIGLIVTVPQGCSSTPYRGNERIRSYPVSLDPNESTTITDLHMSMIGIRRLLSRLHATNVVSQISIVGATFSDGEKWTLTKSGKNYDDQMYGATAQLRCGVKVSGVSYADGLGAANASCANGAKLAHVLILLLQS